MKYKHLEVLLDDSIQIETELDCYQLFQMIGESALYFLETHPERCRDAKLIAVFKTDEL